jgi:hypothetical protein
MIRTLGGRQLLTVWQTLARFREVVAGDHRMTLILTENDLLINPERIFQIIREDLRREGLCAIISPSITDEQEKNRVAVCGDFTQTCYHLDHDFPC